jgi:ribbon-helix-helix CopG family protein
MIREEVDEMADLLIRDVSDDVLAAIDAKARRLGISRTEYLRRTLAREGATASRSVTVADLSRFADAFAGLGDEDLMRRAWE